MRQASSMEAMHQLSDIEIEVINNKAIRMLLDQDASVRKGRMWMKWRHVLFMLQCVHAFARPLRKHGAMEKIKSFIDASWRGARLRLCMKKFLRNTRIIQSVTRLSLRVHNMAREKVIAPQLEYQETLLIGENAGFDKAAVRTFATATLEAKSVDEWRQELNRVGNIKMCFSLTKQAGQLSGDAARQAQAIHHQARAAKRRPSGMHATRGTVVSTVRRSLVVPAVRGNPLQNARESMITREVVENVMELEALSAQSIARCLSTYRLSSEQHSQVAREILRVNVESWWQSYKAYKLQLPLMKAQWATWRQKAVHLGKDLEHQWPPQPATPPYPQELTKLHPSVAKHYLMQHLRENPQSMLLF